MHKLNRFLDRYTPIKRRYHSSLEINGILILVMRLDWESVSFTTSRMNEMCIQSNITPKAVTL